MPTDVGAAAGESEAVGLERGRLTRDPETLELEEFELPRAEARPRRLAVTSTGELWYVDYAGGNLGRFDPETGEVDEWSVPGGAEARPYGMAVDGVVESGVRPNRFVGFDPATEEFFTETAIASGGGTVRHIYFVP